MILEARELCKTYRVPGRWFGSHSVAALAGVTLGVARGERLAISGPSGGGKSTLLGCLSGLTRPSGGSVRYTGAPRGLRLLFQHPTLALNPRFTVFECVAEPLRLAGSALADASTMLGRVGLDLSYGKRLPGELSGGERQRVALARALVGAPEVVLADEPVSALDPTARAEILDLLLELQLELGFACIIVSHDEAVRAATRRHVVIEAGRVVTDSSAAY